jgi:hypothetical protein
MNHELIIMLPTTKVQSDDYVDNDMLVMNGRLFVLSAKRLRVLKSSELSRLQVHNSYIIIT